ncbi:nitronate monooxygenase [Sphingomonas sp. H39-1-10]|uniref:NAD(P)H-dependent flavin oxidoreductase n=1 Tax=Sphingomonas TaxID=13687 RepID=UPI000885F0F3|nr:MULTISPECIES: nitronate monooxygenase [Sphingomonas]MDF0489593.1 nitronate monooxygenase [Sphingomonas pollutisoli]SDA28349.1 nitronate monooxygenase [Sphingomonas sp. NFR15]
MTLPAALSSRLAIPAIVAPMFLVSGPDLVVACCTAGLLGTFPALNQRTTEGFEQWLEEIAARLTAVPRAAPFGVNLIVHKSNTRLDADLARIVAHKVPLVITSLGAVSEVVRAVQSYGGLVLHDVISTRHAEKAVSAGVDGLIAVCAGAGGHAGTLSPFALVSEIRTFFDGPLALAGAITQGRHIAAARVMGADLGYIGSHFIVAEESLASDAQKAMMLDARAADVVYTDRVTGVNANFLAPSLAAATLPDMHGALSIAEEARAWKSIWSAGQGVGTACAVRPAAEICAALVSEYQAAKGIVL